MPQKRTFKALSKELINNPFFPLLFISEAVKIGVLDGFTADFVTASVLAVVCVFLWVISDAIDVEIDEENIIGD